MLHYALSFSNLSSAVSFDPEKGEMLVCFVVPSVPRSGVSMVGGVCSEEAAKLGRLSVYAFESLF